MKKIIALSYIAWASALPVFAQDCAAGTQCLENPLRFPTIEKFIEGFLKAIVMIAIPVIVAFMVYAGFQYIIARGNPGKIKEAHANFLYVIIGTALVLGSWVLATLIGGTVTSLLRG